MMRMACQKAFLGVSILLLSLLVPNGAETASHGGFLGCRFSRSLCQWDEECVDDRLFGNCQKYLGPRDNYQYLLDGLSLEMLEQQVGQLLQRGYVWEDVYTQCVLGNMLLSFRQGIDPDPAWCDGGSTEEPEELGEEAAALLDMYFQDQLNSREEYQERPLSSEEVQDYDGYPLGGISAEKKDEFVKVHKYFSNEKRSGEEDVTSAEINSALSDLLDRLQPSDLEAVQEYMRQDMNDGEKRLDLFPQIADTEDTDSAGYQFAGDSYPNDLSYDDSNEYSEEEDNFTDEDNLIAADADEIESQQGVDGMNPGDAHILSDLVQDRISVEDLDEDQIKRLLDYVESMLINIKGQQPTISEERQIGEQEVLKDEDVKRTDDSLQHVVKKEQMNENVMENPSGNAHIRVVSHKREPSPGANLQDEGIEVEVATMPDHHDHHWDDPMVNTHTQGPKFEVVDANFGYVRVKPRLDDYAYASKFLEDMEQILNLSSGTLTLDGVSEGDITFEVHQNPKHLNASKVGQLAMSLGDTIKNVTNIIVVSAGIGRENKVSIEDNQPKYFVLTFVLCGSIACIVLTVIALYTFRNHSAARNKLTNLGSANVEGTEASKDYQDLCRQRMQGKASEKPEPLSAAARMGSVTGSENRSPSSRSSTSSWSEEPVQSNMDISTGHIVLSYMEDHLKNKDRLDEEWTGLEAYEAEPNETTAANDTANMRRNRYTDILPYDHSRVVLSSSTNVSGADYINASSITDHDPRNPAYIATQGPLPHTVADFWQMVWEQGSVVIVMLTKLTENGVSMCHRYWPEEGSDLYHIYEVHLVSEHIWCDDYLVRSFYLKNLQTNETRTVTQFHFLTWPDLGIPASTKALLDFRRKVNKSYRGRSCPILVHCSDGVGRTGSYCLVDMVLNRLSKGAKEIDIAATLEHIRDQRMGMVKTKEQFEFALASVAEEVHAILKALPQ